MRFAMGALGRRAGRADTLRLERLVGLLAIVCLILVPLDSAEAQVRVGRDSSTRLNRFGRDFVYGVARALAYAEYDQLRKDPPQWGTGWEGYRKRAASDIGEFVVQEGATEALAAALHRPLDYEPCPCHGFGNRLRWALWGSVTDPMPHGSHPIAAPRIIGAYAGSFAQAWWRPAGSDRVRTALLNGTLSLLIGAGINVVQEMRR